MTFWELVQDKTFYWQMITLHEGRQILADGRTKRKPLSMPSGTVYIRHLSVPADLSMYKIGGLGGWTTSFAGTTLTIRMLKEVDNEM